MGSVTLGPSPLARPYFKTSAIGDRMITKPNFTLFLNYFRQFPFCDYRTELLLEEIIIGTSSEQWIADSLVWYDHTELFWEFYAVMPAEELPNRICFRVNLVMLLRAMVLWASSHDVIISSPNVRLKVAESWRIRWRPSCSHFRRACPLEIASKMSILACVSLAAGLQTLNC